MSVTKDAQVKSWREGATPAIVLPSAGQALFSGDEDTLCLLDDTVTDLLSRIAVDQESDTTSR